jgi:ammonia channel protein AmtB
MNQSYFPLYVMHVLLIFIAWILFGYCMVYSIDLKTWTSNNKSSIKTGISEATVGLHKKIKTQEKKFPIWKLKAVR